MIDLIVNHATEILLALTGIVTGASALVNLVAKDSKLAKVLNLLALNLKK